MLSTISVGVHKPENIDKLAEWGFDFVVNTEVKANDVWEREIERVHNKDMQYIACWPDYRFLDLVGKEKYAFYAYDGRNNVGFSGRVDGPSHWNKDAEQISIASLQPVVDVGIDGVLIKATVCDRSFPTDWYPYGDRAIQGTRYYWSFDEEAKWQWKEFSGGKPMPEACQCFDGACAADQLDFYRWYQDGWISKITRLSDVAIDAGMKHIWTYLIPHSNWTEVNMADGTADCILPLETWRQHVISRGAEPLVVVACHFGLATGWPVWFADSEQTIRKVCASPLNWKLIVGAETVYTANSVIRNVSKHSQVVAEMGGCGLFSGDTYLFDWEQDTGPYKETFLAAKKLFETT